MGGMNKATLDMREICGVDFLSSMFTNDDEEGEKGD